MYDLLNALSLAVHALQIERGCTTVYLYSSGSVFQDRVGQSRRHVDVSLERLGFVIEATTFEDEKGKALKKYIKDSFDDVLKAIEQLRPREEDSFNGGGFVKSFSEQVISMLILTMKKISYHLSDANPSQVGAFNNFMALKDVMGKERALGACMFIQPDKKVEHARVVHFLLQEQHLHELAFTELADESVSRMSQDFLEWNEQENVAFQDLLQELDDDYHAVSLDRMDVETWFDLMTFHINRMLDVELYIISQLFNSLIDQSNLKLSDKIGVDTPIQKGILRAMHEVPLFKNVSEDVLEKLSVDASLMHVERGTSVIEAGEKPDNLYIILKGWVKTYQYNERGDEAILQLLGRGEEIAGSAVYRHVVVKYSAKFVSEGVLLKLNAEAVRNLIKQGGTLLTNAFVTLATRSQRQLQQLEQLSLCNVEERIFVFLQSLAGNEFTVESEQNSEDYKITLPFSKTVMASALNISPESLSRGFAKLKEKGLIGINGNVITIYANLS